MGVVIKHRGNFNNLEKFLKRSSNSRRLISILEKYGKEGVTALSNATPIDTGATADAWSYSCGVDDGGLFLEWYNDNRTPGGPPIVILLHYGHGTQNGGYVTGQDFITPITKPLFDEIADAIWREVTG